MHNWYSLTPRVTVLAAVAAAAFKREAGRGLRSLQLLMGFRKGVHTGFSKNLSSLVSQDEVVS